MFVAGVQACCADCVFRACRNEYYPEHHPENQVCGIHAPRATDACSGGAQPRLPAALWCGEFLPREPKEVNP